MTSALIYGLWSCDTPSQNTQLGPAQIQGPRSSQWSLAAKLCCHLQYSNGKSIQKVRCKTDGWLRKKGFWKGFLLIIGHRNLSVLYAEESKENLKTKQKETIFGRAGDKRDLSLFSQKCALWLHCPQPERPSFWSRLGGALLWPQWVGSWHLKRWDYKLETILGVIVRPCWEEKEAGKERRIDGQIDLLQVPPQSYWIETWQLTCTDPEPKWTE